MEALKIESLTDKIDEWNKYTQILHFQNLPAKKVWS